MPLVDPARLAAALKRLGLTELQAQSRGINLHPDKAPIEVRGLLDGSEPLDAVEEVEAVEELAPEPEVEVEADVEPEAEDEDADEASEGDEASDEEPGDEDIDEDAEDEEGEAEAVANPAADVTVDAFEALAVTLTDEQLTAALADTRKGVQVIAQTVLDERA